ncbi:uncharacterized protein LOC127719713 [Mytilus californianus]|uniref:uncharacterized protein LOC127719713 n=1 Tax=Mytilus californianus TaxID=6549 RepID=UPI002246C3CA|nr:uncharacterized protein LOC127719713 [Mytilus californianus]XP_052081919.1 uncharacterized protein LOC127719713 [Mytilus californianus]
MSDPEVDNCKDIPKMSKGETDFTGLTTNNFTGDDAQTFEKQIQKNIANLEEEEIKNDNELFYDTKSNLDLTTKSNLDLTSNAKEDIGDETYSKFQLIHEIKEPNDDMINESLVCGLCQQYLQDPKLLPCLHTFCLNCLEKLCFPEEKNETLKDADFEVSAADGINGNKNDITEVLSCDHTMTDKVDNSKYKKLLDMKNNKEEKVKTTSVLAKIGLSPKTTHCPTCMEIFEMPVKGLEELHSNTVFSNMIKIREKLNQTKQCEICKLRDIVEEATAFCKDCSDMLCKSCWQSHSFTRFTLNHKVVPLEEMKDKALDDAIRNKSKPMCSLHEDELLKYFCSDCKFLVCRECILLHHQGHSCILPSVAVDPKKKEIESLIYGFHGRLENLRKDEHEEYESQNDRVAVAENTEIEKINSFFQKLVEAVEKERQSIISNTKAEFTRLKTQSKNRFSCSENIEKNMTSIHPALHILTSQASDEDFLQMEPILHKRLVQMINKDIKPYPVSWYSLPVVDVVSSLKISCRQDKNIDLSLFKVTGPKQKFEPAESIPIQSSYDELVEMGKFRRISPQPLNVEEITGQASSKIKPEDSSLRKKNFVDATVWSQPHSGNVGKEDHDLESDSESSDSSWVDASSDNQNPSVGKKKRSRGKRGGKKQKGERQKVDVLQNMAQSTFPKDKGIVNEPLKGLKRSPQTSIVFGNPTNMYGLMNNPAQNMQSCQPSYRYPTTVPVPGNVLQMYGSVPNLYTMPQQDGFQSQRPSLMMDLAWQQRKDSHKQQKESRSRSVSSEDKSVSSTSAAAAAIAKPSKVISLQPKWRLDTKLSIDIHEPNLRSVYCLQVTSIIVSDVKNSKVKIFTTKGEFIKCFDLKSVNQAIFTANLLIYSVKNQICAIKEDGTDMNPLIFNNTPFNCLVTWSPKNTIVVSTGVKIRQYRVDENKGNFIKNLDIGIGSSQIQQIVDLRCDHQGKKLVVIDGISKSVSVLDFEGNLLGTYKEDSPGWNPTSACFDKKGLVFVTDGGGNRLVYLSVTAQFIQQWDTCPTINKPSYVATHISQPLYLIGHDRYVHVYDYLYL